MEVYFELYHFLLTLKQFLIFHQLAPALMLGVILAVGIRFCHRQPGASTPLRFALTT